MIISCPPEEAVSVLYLQAAYICWLIPPLGLKSKIDSECTSLAQKYPRILCLRIDKDIYQNLAKRCQLSEIGCVARILHGTVAWSELNPPRKTINKQMDLCSFMIINDTVRRIQKDFTNSLRMSRISPIRGLMMESRNTPSPTSSKAIGRLRSLLQLRNSEENCGNKKKLAVSLSYDSARLPKLDFKKPSFPPLKTHPKFHQSVSSQHESIDSRNKNKLGVYRPNQADGDEIKSPVNTQKKFVTRLSIMLQKPPENEEVLKKSKSVPEYRNLKFQPRSPYNES